ncbi:hypothetical protein AYX13_01809 [Cryptococcus neoformans]|nr:hypothetical protein AYX13_01809 [Cryptococcus neoformans var. grubii]
MPPASLRSDGRSVHRTRLEPHHDLTERSVSNLCGCARCFRRSRSKQHRRLIISLLHRLSLITASPYPPVLCFYISAMDPQGRSPSPEQQGVKFPRFGPDGQPLKAVIKNVDMSEEMQQKAVEIVFESFDRYDQEKDMAMYVKKQFDRLYGTTWHCVVGKNFGSFVTHESKNFIYFYLGRVAILLWKTT